MKAPTRNTLSGRVYRDLQNLARRQGRPTEELLVIYMLEGYLTRLSISPYRTTSFSKVACCSQRSMCGGQRVISTFTLTVSVTRKERSLRLAAEVPGFIIDFRVFEKQGEQEQRHVIKRGRNEHSEHRVFRCRDPSTTVLSD